MGNLEALSYKNEKIQLLIKEIVNILKKHINQPFKVYLFGSFARGEASKFSDIDLAIETIKPLSRTQFRKIKEEINSLRTLRKIDLIYLNTASKKLKDVIKKEGVLIYEFRG
ncbi:MAG: nucleotidyltransferase domain-containing protein [Aquificae bacterium]|nr:nucleotidyltransferase domain-containing protein [Aquificota bacterium]